MRHHIPPRELMRSSILAPRWGNRFQRPSNPQSVILQMQHGVIAASSSDQRRGARRGLPAFGSAWATRRAVGHRCLLAVSHSLIMINIRLEAAHYRLPPQHLRSRTPPPPDTSPSIPRARRGDEGSEREEEEKQSDLFKSF